MVGLPRSRPLASAWLQEDEQLLVAPCSACAPIGLQTLWVTDKAESVMPDELDD